MMNAHVELYYRLLCLQAAAQGRPFAQLMYYTWATWETNPTWQPD